MDVPLSRVLLEEGVNKVQTKTENEREVCSGQIPVRSETDRECWPIEVWSGAFTHQANALKFPSRVIPLYLRENDNFVRSVLRTRQQSNYIKMGNVNNDDDKGGLGRQDALAL